MNEYNDKIYDDDLDLEDILSPRCEYRVSSGFKDRVMSEARYIQKKRRHRRIFYFTSSVAAATVAIVVMATMHFRKSDTPVETTLIMATIENKTATPSDTIKINSRPQLLAAAPRADLEKEPVSKIIQTKKDNSRRTKTSNLIILETTKETYSQQVAEGEMPMINKEESLDPDEIRSRLIESRRNSELAYIEQVRDEIEANQAYISQLMTEENVYQ